MAYFDQLESRRMQIFKIATRYGASNVRIFGSVVKGEDTADSDIDVLVEYLGEPTYDRYIGLLNYLESLLCRKVDLVTADALKPRIRPTVLKEAIHVAGLEAISR